jgi:hypothetical protein
MGAAARQASARSAKRRWKALQKWARLSHHKKPVASGTRWAELAAWFSCSTGLTISTKSKAWGSATAACNKPWD